MVVEVEGPSRVGRWFCPVATAVRGDAFRTAWARARDNQLLLGHRKSRTLRCRSKTCKNQGVWRHVYLDCHYPTSSHSTSLSIGAFNLRKQPHTADN